MGQDFDFYNETRNTKEDADLPYHGRKLSQLSTEQIRVRFENVIQQNRWSLTDTVRATGDYGDEVVYRSGNIEVIGS